MGVEIFSNYVLCGIREGEGLINNSIGVYSLFTKFAYMGKQCHLVQRLKKPILIYFHIADCMHIFWCYPIKLTNKLTPLPTLLMG